MSNAWHHFQAGGWAIWTILICLALGLGAAVLIVQWVRRLWRRPDLPLRTRVIALIVGGVASFAAWGLLLGLVKAFGAVGGESVDPSQKARILAEGIAEAMNCAAFGILVGLPSVLVLAFLTKKQRGESN